MITIRVSDRVEGRVVQHAFENVTVAMAMLVSLFSRPAFDPWAQVYPMVEGQDDTACLSVSTFVDSKGDITVVVERFHRDALPELPS